MQFLRYIFICLSSVFILVSMEEGNILPTKEEAELAQQKEQIQQQLTNKPKKSGEYPAPQAEILTGSEGKQEESVKFESLPPEINVMILENAIKDIAHDAKGDSLTKIFKTIHANLNNLMFVNKAWFEYVNINSEATANLIIQELMNNKAIESILNEFDNHYTQAFSEIIQNKFPEHALFLNSIIADKFTKKVLFLSLLNTGAALQILTQLKKAQQTSHQLAEQLTRLAKYTNDKAELINLLETIKQLTKVYLKLWGADNKRFNDYINDLSSLASLIHGNHPELYDEYIAWLRNTLPQKQWNLAEKLLSQHISK